MELTDKPLSLEESMNTIQFFIARTKENLQRRSFDFLLWGVLICLASLANYFLIKNSFEKAYLPWPVLMISGVIATSIYHSTTGSKKAVLTFADRFLQWLFISSAAIYFLLAFFCVRQHISPLPFMLALSALLIFVTGAVLRFKALIAGGVLFFAASAGSVLLNYNDQLLLTSITVLAGYIVPGVLLRNTKAN